jgi:sulfur transfer protein SufE
MDWSDWFMQGLKHVWESLAAILSAVLSLVAWKYKKAADIRDIEEAKTKDLLRDLSIKTAVQDERLNGFGKILEMIQDDIRQILDLVDKKTRRK